MSCCVMVEPPKSFFIDRNMLMNAPVVRYQSTPLCL